MAELTNHFEMSDKIYARKQSQNIQSKTQLTVTETSLDGHHITTTVL